MSLFAAAQARPDALALSDGTTRRTTSELAAAIARRVHAWQALGLRPDDRLALIAHNSVDSLECVLAAVVGGFWIVPVNWHLTEPEIRYVLADAGTRLVLADAHHAALARRAAPIGARVLELGAEHDASLARAASAPPSLDGMPGGTMIYTSGTTGRPKGVQRGRQPTVRAQLELFAATGRRLGLDGSGAHLVTGPAYHAAPLLFALYDLTNGAAVHLMPRWDERAFMLTVARERIAHTHLVPTMFVRLCKLPDAERAAFDPAPLSLVLHGAAPISEDVKRRMIEWWGPKLVEYWGATEGGVYTLVDSPSWLAHPRTVGRALDTFEVFAVDDAGVRLAPGAIGTLYCRHRTLARPFEYFGDRDKTERAFLEPGVFTAGDIGYVDDEGWVFLTDRKSHLIISGGVNIYPAEVEQVMARHPAVADVAVFGIPDPDWGESVKAAVELEPGYEASPELERALLDACRAELAGYKVPRSIDFESRLPRYPTGKLYVARLKARYWP